MYKIALQKYDFFFAFQILLVYLYHVHISVPTEFC